MQVEMEQCAVSYGVFYTDKDFSRASFLNQKNATRIHNPSEAKEMAQDCYGLMGSGHVYLIQSTYYKSANKSFQPFGDWTTHSEHKIIEEGVYESGKLKWIAPTITGEELDNRRRKTISNYY